MLGPGWHERGGISAEYVYTGEIFTLARGGFNTNDATQYRGGFDLLVGLDTEAMQLWRGGLFNLYAFNTHGRTLTADYLGDAQYYSNIDTSPKPADVTELGEYWYQHTFAEGGFSVKIGKQDANGDFAYGDLGGDFVNSSFATVPNVPLPAWPFQALGVSCFVHRDEWLTVGGGVYDGDRDRGQFWFSTDHGYGAFSILQADIRPRAGEEDALPSTIRLGAWHKTADTWDLAEDELHDGNYGFYALGDQLLWGEADDSTQGSEPSPNTVGLPRTAIRSSISAARASPTGDCCAVATKTSRGLVWPASGSPKPCGKPRE